MKVKNMIIGALMTVIAAPVAAQAQQDEIMSQVTTIIKSGAPDALKQVQALEKLHKKDANALISIGKAFLAQKDYANAKVYGEKATKVDQKNGAGWVLLGNIAVGEDNGGEAAGYFQQAQYFDPKNPDGYRRYAQIMSKTDPNGAVATLEELRRNCPDYPVDLIAAEIQSEAGNMAKANEYYSRVSLDKMKDYQISDYATNLFLSQKYDESLKVATAGHAKFARNASFNRLIMFNQVENKNFDAAVVAGNDLVNNSDSLKMSAFDYGYYGRALEGAKKYNEAIDLYKKMQGDANMKDEDKINANKSISDCYKKVSNFAQAGEYLTRFINAQKQTSFGLQESVAQLYADQVKDESTAAADKKVAYDKAIALYKELAEKYPDNAVYCSNQCGNLSFALPGSDLEKLKIAAPHFENIITILADKADRSKAETNILKTSYNYVTVYYVHVADNMEKAKELAAKLLELDPENANAKAILGVQ
ncbi:MAG: tetratricopeptide repeat protein [Prevotella sp.]|nr:tetratricopeptide repeat protein [Candidatus Prevotella equi]